MIYQGIIERLGHLDGTVIVQLTDTDGETSSGQFYMSDLQKHGILTDIGVRFGYKRTERLWPLPLPWWKRILGRKP